MFFFFFLGGGGRARGTPKEIAPALQAAVLPEMDFAEVLEPRSAKGAKEDVGNRSRPESAGWSWARPLRRPWEAEVASVFAGAPLPARERAVLPAARLRNARHPRQWVGNDKERPRQYGFWNPQPQKWSEDRTWAGNAEPGSGA